MDSSRKKQQLPSQPNSQSNKISQSTSVSYQDQGVGYGSGSQLIRTISSNSSSSLKQNSNSAQNLSTQSQNTLRASISDQNQRYHIPYDNALAGEFLYTDSNLSQIPIFSSSQTPYMIQNQIDQVLGQHQKFGHQMPGNYHANSTLANISQKGSQYINQQQFNLLKQQQSQQTPVSKNLFFESPSKYISLKKHRQDHKDYLASQLEELLELQKKSQKEFASLQPQSQHNKDQAQIVGGVSKASQPIRSSKATQVKSSASLQNKERFAPFLHNVDVKDQLELLFSRQPLKYDNSQRPYKVQSWFQSLSVADKGLVLTIVDKQLVKLIIAMYDVYQNHSYAKFTSSHLSTGIQKERLRTYEHFPGLQYIEYSGTSRIDPMNRKNNSILEGEDELIAKVRLLKLDTVQSNKIELTTVGANSKSKDSSKKGAGQKQHKQVEKVKMLEKTRINNIHKCMDSYDAITIELSHYWEKKSDNCNFFFEMMKKVNQERSGFLEEELAIASGPDRLDNSIFYAHHFPRPSTSSSQTHANEQDSLGIDPTTFARRVDTSASASKKKEQAKSQPADQGALNSLPSTYMTLETAKSCKFLQESGGFLSLGQLLYLVFERAITIQYLDYHGKLAKTKNYFFIEPANNIFVQELNLTFYWIKLEQVKRLSFGDALNTLEKKIKEEERQQILQEAKETQIKEQVSEEDEGYEESDDTHQSRSRPSQFKREQRPNLQNQAFNRKYVEDWRSQSEIMEQEEEEEEEDQVRFKHAKTHKGFGGDMIFGSDQEDQDRFDKRGGRLRRLIEEEDQEEEESLTPTHQQEHSFYIVNSRGVFSRRESDLDATISVKSALKSQIGRPVKQGGGVFHNSSEGSSEASDLEQGLSKTSSKKQKPRKIERLQESYALPRDSPLLGLQAPYLTSESQRQIKSLYEEKKRKQNMSKSALWEVDQSEYDPDYLELKAMNSKPPPMHSRISAFDAPNQQRTLEQFFHEEKEEDDDVVMEDLTLQVEEEPYYSQSQIPSSVQAQQSLVVQTNNNSLKKAQLAILINTKSLADAYEFVKLISTHINLFEAQKTEFRMFLKQRFFEELLSSYQQSNLLALEELLDTPPKKSKDKKAPTATTTTTTTIVTQSNQLTPSQKPQENALVQASEAQASTQGTSTAQGKVGMLGDSTISKARKKKMKNKTRKEQMQLQLQQQQQQQQSTTQHNLSEAQLSVIKSTIETVVKQGIRNTLEGAKSKAVDKLLEGYEEQDSWRKDIASTSSTLNQSKIQQTTSTASQEQKTASSKHFLQTTDLWGQSKSNSSDELEPFIQSTIEKAKKDLIKEAAEHTQSITSSGNLEANQQDESQKGQVQPSSSLTQDGGAQQPAPKKNKKKKNKKKKKDPTTTITAQTLQPNAQTTNQQPQEESSPPPPPVDSQSQVSKEEPSYNLNQNTALELKEKIIDIYESSSYLNESNQKIAAYLQLQKGGSTITTREQNQKMLEYLKERQKPAQKQLPQLFEMLELKELKANKVRDEPQAFKEESKSKPGGTMWDQEEEEKQGVGSATTAFEYYDDYGTSGGSAESWDSQHRDKGHNHLSYYQSELVIKQLGQKMRDEKGSQERIKMVQALTKANSKGDQSSYKSLTDEINQYQKEQQSKRRQQQVLMLDEADETTGLLTGKKTNKYRDLMMMGEESLDSNKSLQQFQIQGRNFGDDFPLLDQELMPLSDQYEAPNFSATRFTYDTIQPSSSYQQKQSQPHLQLQPQPHNLDNSFDKLLSKTLQQIPKQQAPSSQSQSLMASNSLSAQRLESRGETKVHSTNNSANKSQQQAKTSLEGVNAIGKDIQQQELLQSESNQQQKKKKKRAKNKKKKKTQQQQQQQQQQVEQAAEQTANEGDIKQQEVKSTEVEGVDKETKSNAVSLGNGEKVITEQPLPVINKHHNQNYTIQENEDGDGIDSINLDQIELSLEEESFDKSSQFFSQLQIENDALKPNLLQSESNFEESSTAAAALFSVNDLLDETRVLPKLQNNFVEPSARRNETFVEVLNLHQDEDHLEIGDLTSNITSQICNQVVSSLEEESDVKVQEAKTPEKSKNDKQMKIHSQQTQQNQGPASKRSKKNKKGQNQKNTNQLKQQQQQQQAKSLINQQSPLAKEGDGKHQVYQSIELASPDQLKKEHINKLYSEIGGGCDLELITSDSQGRSKSTKKHVEFRITREEKDEDIHIPKRGSSRGSSVGTEEVIHQHTLNGLEDLFPPEYKNPSDDTRIKINEISSSSESSPQTPKMNSSLQESKAILSAASASTTHTNQKQNASKQKQQSAASSQQSVSISNVKNQVQEVSSAQQHLCQKPTQNQGNKKQANSKEVANQSQNSSSNHQQPQLNNTHQRQSQQQQQLNNKESSQTHPQSMGENFLNQNKRRQNAPHQSGNGQTLIYQAKEVQKYTTSYIQRISILGSQPSNLEAQSQSELSKQQQVIAPNDSSKSQKLENADGNATPINPSHTLQVSISAQDSTDVVMVVQAQAAFSISSEKASLETQQSLNSQPQNSSKMPKQQNQTKIQTQKGQQQSKIAKEKASKQAPPPQSMNFDSYEAMFQTAYDDKAPKKVPQVDIEATSYQVQPQKVKETSLAVNSGSQDAHSQGQASAPSSNEESKNSNSSKIIEESKVVCQDVKPLSEIAASSNNEQQDVRILEQDDKAASSQITITSSIEPIKSDEIISTDIYVDQKQPMTNQPIQNQKRTQGNKKNQGKVQENRELKESGVSVNPDVFIQSQAQAKKINPNQQANPQGQVMGPSQSAGSNQIAQTAKKVKPKAMKQQNQLNLGQQESQLQGMNMLGLQVPEIDQRSQTPNIEQTREPLLKQNPQQQNQLKKQNQGLNQKQMQPNPTQPQHTGQSKSNQKKKGQVQHQNQQFQQQLHHQQYYSQNMMSSQFDRFVQFDQQQQMLMQYQQNMINALQQQQSGFLMNQHSLHLAPTLSPNPQMHGVQQFQQMNSCMLQNPQEILKSQSPAQMQQINNPSTTQSQLGNQTTNIQSSEIQETYPQTTATEGQDPQQINSVVQTSQGDLKHVTAQAELQAFAVDESLKPQQKATASSGSKKKSSPLKINLIHPQESLLNRASPNKNLQDIHSASSIQIIPQPNQQILNNSAAAYAQFNQLQQNQMLSMPQFSMGPVNDPFYFQRQQQMAQFQDPAVLSQSINTILNQNPNIIQEILKQNYYQQQLMMQQPITPFNNNPAMLGQQFNQPFTYIQAQNQQQLNQMPFVQTNLQHMPHPQAIPQQKNQNHHKQKNNKAQTNQQQNDQQIQLESNSSPPQQLAQNQYAPIPAQQVQNLNTSTQNQPQQRSAHKGQQNQANAASNQSQHSVPLGVVVSSANQQVKHAQSQKYERPNKVFSPGQQQQHTGAKHVNRNQGQNQLAQNLMKSPPFVPHQQNSQILRGDEQNMWNQTMGAHVQGNQYTMNLQQQIPMQSQNMIGQMSGYFNHQTNQGQQYTLPNMHQFNQSQSMPSFQVSPQLFNQNFGYVNQAHLPNISNPPHGYNINQQYNRANFNNHHSHNQHHNHSQANYNYQQQQHVSHQSLEQYRAQTREEQFYQKFDREIYKLTNNQHIKLQRTEPERQAAFKQIENIVKQAFQEYVNVKVQMYGSMATGLAIDSSDMDILVSGVFSGEGLFDRTQLIEQMRRLHKQLNKLFCIESNSLIESATFPVIKITIDMQKIREHLQGQSQQPITIDDDMKLLKVDITFNENENDQLQSATVAHLAQPAHLGIQCCLFIKQKLQEYPLLGELTLLLKKFLALRDLNSPFFGGLSSYGLILLIISFLNMDLPQTYDPITQQLSPSRVFSNFLQYFGKVFDVKLNIINEQQQIVPPSFISFQSVLMIIDPLNPSNNIGKSSYNFDQIRHEFGKAYDTIIKLYNEFVNDGIEKIANHEEFGKLHGKKNKQSMHARQNQSGISTQGSSTFFNSQEEKQLNILQSILYIESPSNSNRVDQVHNTDQKQGEQSPERRMNQDQSMQKEVIQYERREAGAIANFNLEEDTTKIEDEVSLSNRRSISLDRTIKIDSQRQ